jgi:hypothetical protein
MILILRLGLNAGHNVKSFAQNPSYDLQQPKLKFSIVLLDLEVAG